MELDMTILAAVVPIVTLLVQLAKQLPVLAKHSDWMPLLSLAIGLAVVASKVLAWPLADVSTGQVIGYIVIHGIVAGLSASGLYSVAGKGAFDQMAKLLK